MPSTSYQAALLFTLFGAVLAVLVQAASILNLQMVEVI